MMGVFLFGLQKLRILFMRGGGGGVFVSFGCIFARLAAIIFCCCCRFLPTGGGGRDFGGGRGENGKKKFRGSQNFSPRFFLGGFFSCETSLSSD
jgi:hypothetical protein